MYYKWEWISELAIIPAWEIALGGFILGLIVGACIVCLMD